MLKEALSQRPVQVALMLFVMICIGGVFYVNRVKTATQRDSVNRETRVGLQEATSPAQGGYYREDGTWHATPLQTPPTGPVKQPERTEAHPEMAETQDTDPTRNPAALDVTPESLRHLHIPPEPLTPLTYNAALLEEHPVEALRQQAIERGHWSVDQIPPFPPEDLEAAALARNLYLIIYYESIGDPEHPVALKAMEEKSKFTHTVNAFIAADKVSPRVYDLAKLIRARLHRPRGLDETPWPSTFARDETGGFIREK